MENLFMAYSNIYAARVVDYLYRQDLVLQSWVLAGAMLSSFFYHLIETQKHKMPGFAKLIDQPGCSPSCESLLINLDRFFAVLSMIVLFNWESFWLYWPYCLGALACMTISEIPFRHEKYGYLFFHTIWHLSAFHLAYLFAQQLNKN